MKTLKQEQVRGNNWLIWWHCGQTLRRSSTSPTTSSGCIRRCNTKPQPLSSSNYCAQQNPEGSPELNWGEGANRPLAPDPTPRFTIACAE